MAGLLDYISGGGGGGLLGALYPSPLLQPQEKPGQIEYDPLGNPIFRSAEVAPSPFGLPPGFNPQDFAPKSAFSGGGAPAPFAPGQTFTAGPTIAPAPQPPQPAPQAAPAAAEPLPNAINVGGYQMPRVGDMAQFTPRAPTDVSAQSRQPAMTQPEQGPMLPTALSGAGSFLSRIGNPDGLIARLTGNDSRSIARENLQAQYKALVPLVGQQKAMLAVMNPEAGKLILEQALATKQKFGVIGKNDGVEQYGFVNERDQSVKPYSAPGVETNREGVAGPDGKIIPFPAGLDAAGRKTFANEIARINADTAAGKKTEQQARDEIFGNKMESANKLITDQVGTSLAGKVASGVPLGNYLQSADYQKYKQAASNFITAILRRESGAAVSPAEFDRYDKELMPQPGDSKEVLAQKAEARRVAIEGMKKGAGPGYKSPTSPALPAGWSVSVR